MVTSVVNSYMYSAINGPRVAINVQSQHYSRVLRYKLVPRAIELGHRRYSKGDRTNVLWNMFVCAAIIACARNGPCNMAPTCIHCSNPSTTSSTDIEPLLE